MPDGFQVFNVLELFQAIEERMLNEVIEHDALLLAVLINCSLQLLIDARIQLDCGHDILPVFE
ncbi:MAG: hypothetical protein R3200_06570 [Xanthomonadales bacterium]|nr:hypothetical protein [Xanthomonadales bacterium]